MSDLGKSSSHNHLNDNTENKYFSSHSLNRKSLSYDKIYQGHKETQLLHPKYPDILSLSAIARDYTQDDMLTIKSAIEKGDSENIVQKIVDDMVAIEHSRSHIVEKDSKRPIRAWPESIVKRLGDVSLDEESWKNFLDYLRDKFPGKEQKSSRDAIRRFVLENAKYAAISDSNRDKRY